jgi:6-phosphogluconolactonase
VTEQLDDSDGRGRPTIEVGAPAELARRVRARIEAIARRAVDRRGRFAFAIPGGSVAQEFLPALSVAAIDWGATDVFWTDERWVPADSPDSNFGQARRLLFGAGPAAAARCHRIRTDGPDTEAAAAAERELIAVAGDRGRLDLILLGVGEDGHVCSLFPGRAELEETNRFVVPVVDAPKPPPRRISLTLPVLAAADHLWIGAFGATKADAVRGALTDPADPRPLARAVRAGRRVTMWLNQAAVGSIDTTPRAGLSEWGG